jgi:hypothetical protein
MLGSVMYCLNKLSSVMSCDVRTLSSSLYMY